jgi:hypothetical protein
LFSFLVFAYAVFWDKPNRTDTGIIDTGIIVVGLYLIIGLPLILTGLLERMFFPLWSISTVWLRTPSADKKSVLNMMISLRLRVGLTCLLIAILSGTIAMEYMISVSVESIFWAASFVRLGVTGIIFGGIGFILSAICIGLLFEKFNRAWVSTAMVVLPGAVFFLLVGLQNYFIPLHLQTANLPASTAYFAASILLLSVVVPWWYRGYFSRRDYNTL